LDIPTVTSFFWDGRETNLHSVVLQPFTNPVEMGRANFDQVMDQIRQLGDYRPYLQKAFQTEKPSSTQIAIALSAYLHSLPQLPTRYEKYQQGGKDHALSEDELKGLSLFSGKAGCSDCHKLSTFTDNEFHHTGIGFEIAAGRIGELVGKLQQLKQERRPLGVSVLANRDISELGRFSFTQKPSDLGAFRTPSLRNVSRTAPYMHDGSAATMSDALDIEIYYRSLERGKPINLTVEERKCLLEFLNSI